MCEGSWIQQSAQSACRRQALQGPCRSEDPPLIAKILEPVQRREVPADVAVRGPPDFQSERNLTLLCFWPN
jgi:hypothetical protein